MVQNSIHQLFKKEDLDKGWKLIEKAQNITLLTHYKPDGDGMCACAALSMLLEKYGKKTFAVYPTPPELDIKRQPKNVLINKHTVTPDLLISCDTAGYDRLYYPEEFKNIPMINVDHHVSNTINGTVNFIAGGLSSTCEQVYHLILGWDARALNTEMAEALLYGILYDTQVFHTPVTTAETLRISADLIDRGANLFALRLELLQNKSPDVILLWGNLLSNVRFSKTKKTAWATISRENLEKNNVKLDSLVGFSNFLAQISGTDVTALFYENVDGKTKVSLRSKHADVNKLAAKFNGGGHVNAAGILLDEPLETVEKKVSAEFE